MLKMKWQAKKLGRISQKMYLLKSGRISHKIEETQTGDSLVNVMKKLEGIQKHYNG